MIPPMTCRRAPREIGRGLSEERGPAERLIDRIAHYRRVATRCEKAARSFLASVHVASALALLR